MNGPESGWEGTEPGVGMALRLFRRILRLAGRGLSLVLSVLKLVGKF